MLTPSRSSTYSLHSALYPTFGGIWKYRESERERSLLIPLSIPPSVECVSTGRARGGGLILLLAYFFIYPSRSSSSAYSLHSAFYATFGDIRSVFIIYLLPLLPTDTIFGGMLKDLKGSPNTGASGGDILRTTYVLVRLREYVRKLYVACIVCYLPSS